jgi:hypothetical protein
MKGIALPVMVAPSSRRCHRSGSQIVRRPATISAPSTIVISSNTWVTPPVGSGSAGTNISTRMVAAKLRSPNTRPSSPSVFGESPRSQASSSSLKRAASGVSESSTRPTYPVGCMVVGFDRLQVV